MAPSGEWQNIKLSSRWEILSDILIKLHFNRSEAEGPTKIAARILFMQGYRMRKKRWKVRKVVLRDGPPTLSYYSASKVHYYHFFNSVVSVFMDNEQNSGLEINPHFTLFVNCILIYRSIFFSVFILFCRTMSSCWNVFHSTGLLLSIWRNMIGDCLVSCTLTAAFCYFSQSKLTVIYLPRETCGRLSWPGWVILSPAPD